MFRKQVIGHRSSGTKFVRIGTYKVDYESLTCVEEQTRCYQSRSTDQESERTGSGDPIQRSEHRPGRSRLL